MYYYKINGLPIQSAIILNESNGYPQGEGEENQLTIEQYNELLNPTPIEPSAEQLLEQARAAKKAQLEIEEDVARASGWEDSQTGLRLFLGDADTIRYTQFKTLHLNDFADTIVEIGTYQGWQPLSNAEAQALLYRYGIYAEALYKSFSDRHIALMFATSIEQINLI